MHYATLHQCRAYLGVSSTTDDALLIGLIEQAVSQIDAYKSRRFDIRRATLYYDYPADDPELIGNYSGSRLAVSKNLHTPDDLQAVATLTNGDGTTIAAADYMLYPYNGTPKTQIRLKSTVTWALPSSGDYQAVIAVDGYWGCHTDYANCWKASGDTVQDNPLTSGATTVTVADADGTATDGQSPRFQAGQMIRIGDEFLYVSAVNTGTNKLTVTRGYNGTTAAQAAQNTAISVYRPMQNIVAACQRLVAYRYRQKDADAFNATELLGAGVKIIPSAMPQDVLALLGQPRLRVY